MTIKKADRIITGAQPIYLDDSFALKNYAEILFFGSGMWGSESEREGVNNYENWDKIYPIFYVYMVRRFGASDLGDIYKELGFWNITTRMKGVYLQVAFLSYGYLHFSLLADEKIAKKTRIEKSNKHKKRQADFAVWVKEKYNFTPIDSMTKTEINIKYTAFIRGKGITEKLNEEDNKKYGSEFWQKHSQFSEPEKSYRSEWCENNPYIVADTGITLQCRKAAEAVIKSFLQGIGIRDTSFNPLGEITKENKEKGWAEEYVPKDYEESEAVLYLTKAEKDLLAELKGEKYKSITDKLNN